MMPDQALLLALAFFLLTAGVVAAKITLSCTSSVS
jgi:hypothetical protein